jgi:hypothetical protein
LLYNIWLPGEYTVTLGKLIGACPTLTPGMFTDWQNHVVSGIRAKVMRNFVGCR